MTGIEHEADGSWLVPLLLLAAICWQVWLTLRHPPPPDSGADADDRPAAAWPFPIDLMGLNHRGATGTQQQHSKPSPRDARFARAVRAIRARDHGFDLQRFLEGAEIAYEKIAIAFADGDADALRPLVTPEVFNAYAAAIAGRTNEDRSTDTVLVRLTEPQLLDVAVRGERADIRVRFLGSWLAVRAGSGNDAADAGATAADNIVFDTADEWTFTRPIAARDPNWRVAASN